MPALEWESGGFCEARRDVGGERDGGVRLIEAGLNEVAVSAALWAEYLAAVAATLMPGGGLRRLGTPGSNDPGYVGAGSAVGRPSDVTGRAVVDG